jgi:hypothetical protein
MGAGRTPGDNFDAAPVRKHEFMRDRQTQSAALDPSLMA